MKFLIICLSTIIYSTIAQQVLNKYPNTVPMANVSISKFIGKWYQIHRIPNQYDRKSKCSTFNFTLYNDGDGVLLNLETAALNDLTGMKDKWTAYGTLQNNSPSQLDLEFPPLATQRKTTLKILDTDYENFHVISMTQVEKDKVLHNVWVCSRKPTLEQPFTARAVAACQRNNIDINLFKTVDQKCYLSKTK
ncbi:apolipoprotein D-like isoform X2 [Aphidius gifuensis]|uniref:apolipoprotein D-like isoform X2 n=1 Tax=Aphidius gifuensis TaxID=684658 RepID=UPI001CDB6361|nr:apolipoprotein D-like isoform X2 [Aphidius gifuensis]